MTSGSQKISPEVGFQKSKYIAENRLPEVKNHYLKSISENQKSLPEVDFRKSKNITGSRLKIKKLSQF